jgi:hypothetical protein
VETTDEKTDAQLAAIGELYDLFEREQIEHWLFGGWAVDFHAGEITRPHDDVDLAVWADDAERISALLRVSGWMHAPDPEEDGGTGYDRDGVRVELTFLVRNSGGRICIRLRAGDFPFAGGAFRGDLLALAGRRCSVIERDALVATKSSGRDGADDQAKDAGDLRRLG